MSNVLIRDVQADDLERIRVAAAAQVPEEERQAVLETIESAHASRAEELGDRAIR